MDEVSVEEDGVVRRLHCLEQLGAELSPEMQQLKNEIRERDRRQEIRDPEDRGVVDPLWIT